MFGLSSLVILLLEIIAELAGEQVTASVDLVQWVTVVDLVHSILELVNLPELEGHDTLHFLHHFRGTYLVDLAQ